MVGPAERKIVDWRDLLATVEHWHNRRLFKVRATGDTPDMSFIYLLDYARLRHFVY